MQEKTRAIVDGVAYWKMGDYDKAISCYTEAIRIDPKDAKIYTNRGLAYKGKGDHDKAMADYTEAIGINPRDAKAYNNRGVAHWERASMIRRLPTSPRPSCSTRKTLTRTATAAWLIETKATTIRRTQTLQRRRGSFSPK